MPVDSLADDEAAAGMVGRVRALGAVDAVFDAAGKGVLADAVALAGEPKRVITLSDPAAADFGVTLSQPTPSRAPGALDETIALLADGRLRLRVHTSMPMQQATKAHHQLESGTGHQRIILTLERELRDYDQAVAAVHARMRSLLDRGQPRAGQPGPACRSRDGHRPDARPRCLQAG